MSKFYEVKKLYKKNSIFSLENESFSSFETEQKKKFAQKYKNVITQNSEPKIQLKSPGYPLIKDPIN